MRLIIGEVPGANPKQYIQYQRLKGKGTADSPIGPRRKQRWRFVGFTRTNWKNGSGVGRRASCVASCVTCITYETHYSSRYHLQSTRQIAATSFLALLDLRPPAGLCPDQPQHAYGSMVLWLASKRHRHVIRLEAELGLKPDRNFPSARPAAALSQRPLLRHRIRNVIGQSTKCISFAGDHACRLQSSTPSAHSLPLSSHSCCSRPPPFLDFTKHQSITSGRRRVKGATNQPSI
jgi:hypothetical protein